MANDFGSNFLRGFQPNFANMFNDSYRYAAIEGERERQRKEQEKAQQEQAGILSQLIKGTKEVPFFQNNQAPLMNAGQSFGKKEIPLGQNEMAGLIGQADNSTLQRLALIQKLNEPQKKELYQFDGNLYEKDNKGGLGNLVKSKEVKPEAPKPIFLKDEVIGDKIRALKGIEEPDADIKDPNVRIINGKKYRITDYAIHDIYEKKTANGENYFDFSADTKKALGDYYKEQQKLRAITNAGFGNRTKNGKEDEPTFKDELVKHNKVYLEAVRNVMKDSAKKWYDDMYNEGGSNIDPRDYIENLKQSFVNGELGVNPNEPDKYDVADFNALLEQFKAIYGFDPREQYGTQLEAVQ